MCALINSILSPFSLTHTLTTMSWSTHAAGKNVCSVLDIREVLRRWDLPLLAKNKHSNFNPSNPTSIPPSQYWFSSCSHRSLFLSITATWRHSLYLNTSTPILFSMQKTVGEKYPGGLLLPYLLSHKATWRSSNGIEETSEFHLYHPYSYYIEHTFQTKCSTRQYAIF